jgi:hypothetical protein
METLEQSFFWSLVDCEFRDQPTELAAVVSDIIKSIIPPQGLFSLSHSLSLTHSLSLSHSILQLTDHSETLLGLSSVLIGLSQLPVSVVEQTLSVPRSLSSFATELVERWILSGVTVVGQSDNLSLASALVGILTSANTSSKVGQFENEWNATDFRMSPTRALIHLTSLVKQRQGKQATQTTLLQFFQRPELRTALETLLQKLAFPALSESWASILSSTTAAKSSTKRATEETKSEKTSPRKKQKVQAEQ